MPKAPVNDPDRCDHRLGQALQEPHAPQAFRDAEDPTAGVSADGPGRRAFSHRVGIHVHAT